MSSYAGSSHSSAADSHFHSSSDNDTPMARRSPEYQPYTDVHHRRGRSHRPHSPDFDEDDYARSPSLSSVNQFSFQQQNNIPSQRISTHSLSRGRQSTVDSMDSNVESRGGLNDSSSWEIRGALDSRRLSYATQRSYGERLPVLEPHSVPLINPLSRHAHDNNQHHPSHPFSGASSRHPTQEFFSRGLPIYGASPPAGGQTLPPLSSLIGDVLPLPVTGRPRGSFASALSTDSGAYSNSPPAYSVASAASPSIYQLSSSQPSHSYDSRHGSTSYESHYHSSMSSDGTIESRSEYRCPHPGCTVAPFSTQYLLNSHLNVHSSSRPHYCPHPGCSRGEGGEGFKRKNEMVRHSHIHMAPKYQCPFCTDQDRKYPRPDNLQRHVKARHPERSLDDPDLREVLSHRPDGHKKGRRRRTVPGN